MAKQNTKSQAKDPEVAIDEAIQKSEGFIEKNGKLLLTILGVIVLVVCGYFGVKSLYLQPRQEKASAMMYAAEMQFAENEFETALSGDGNFAGFLEVIDQYGGTPAGNLARHYAGKCYIHLGQFEQAIRYFKEYKTVKGRAAEVINAQNYGMIGDAYAELAQLKEAADNYEKAVKASENELTAPYYLRKLGLVSEKLGDKKKALDAYQQIKTGYGTTMEARDIDKYIGRLEQQL